MLVHVWFQPLHAQMLAVGVAAAPPGIVHSYAVFSACCRPMADRVRRITLSVRATTAATADYQRLIREIQRPTRTSPAGGVLRWVYVGRWLVARATGGFIIGFGPRPPAGTAGPGYCLFFVFFGAVQVLVGI